MRKLQPLTFALFILIVAHPKSGFAQGCSDAGFCTIGNLNQQHGTTINRGQKLTLLLPLGVGDENVLIFTPGLQYDHQLSNHWAVQGKLTANYATGNLGAATGLGDIFLSGTYLFDEKKKWKTSITLGTKLPLNLGNLKTDGISLPMQYQSSLGTIDLITGFSIANEHWQFSGGWQQPLSGINRNNFLPEYWNKSEAEKYPPSNDFKRKGDILLRVAYTIHVKQKFTLTTGLLGIYHISEDTYVNANISNNPIIIRGSQGLTLNATLAGFWKVSDHIMIGFSAGAPLLFRDVRPDGLTRSIVVAPEVRWNF
jgi:hypothetical protein